VTQAFELLLFQTRDGRWRVRIDGLPGGRRQYTAPMDGVTSAMLEANVLVTRSRTAERVDHSRPLARD
jgi:hypothetical protein